MLTIPFGRVWVRFWRPKYWWRWFWMHGTVPGGWILRLGPFEVARVGEGNPYRQKLRWSR